MDIQVIVQSETWATSAPKTESTMLFVNEISQRNSNQLSRRRQIVGKVLLRKDDWGSYRLPTNALIYHNAWRSSTPIKKSFIKIINSDELLWFVCSLVSSHSIISIVHALRSLHFHDYEYNFCNIWAIGWFWYVFLKLSDKSLAFSNNLDHDCNLYSDLYILVISSPNTVNSDELSGP